LEKCERNTGHMLKVKCLKLDLEFNDSIKNFVRTIVSLLKKNSRIDKIILSAAIGGAPARTSENILKQLQVNHLGHILMLDLLLSERVFNLGAEVLFIGSEGSRTIGFEEVKNIFEGQYVEMDKEVMTEVQLYLATKSLSWVATTFYNLFEKKFKTKVAFPHGTVETELSKKYIESLPDLIHEVIPIEVGVHNLVGCSFCNQKCTIPPNFYKFQSETQVCELMRKTFELIQRPFPANYCNGGARLLVEKEEITKFQRRRIGFKFRYADDGGIASWKQAL